MTGLKQSVSLGTLAVALGCLAAPAMAQEIGGVPSDQPTTTTPSDIKPDKKTKADVKKAEADDDSAIVVTGTHLARPNMTSPAPIVSIGAREIAQQGAINVYDVLQTLPQITPDPQGLYQDGTGQQQVMLRGLGPNRTLSLIDGLRISTSEGININAVPVALIDRIDVLTGGAASIYGADAVAGVVNFVLKKGYNGLQINASSSGYLHDNDGNNLGAQIARQSGASVPHGTSLDGGTVDVNMAFGHSFFDDRLSVEGYAGYTKIRPILTDDRDYSSCYLTQSGVKNSIPTCSVDSTTQPYGTFVPESPLAGVNQGKAFSDAKNGSQTFVANDPSFNYQNFRGNYLLQPSKRYNGGLFLDLDLGSGLSAYGNYNISYTESVVQHGPYYGFRVFDRTDYGDSTTTVINCNNPLLSSQQQGILCGSAAGTAQQVPLSARYLLNTTYQDVYKNMDQRVAAGVRGKFLNDALKFDLNFVYSQFKNTLSNSPNDGPHYNFDHLQQSLLVGGTASAPTCLSGTPGCVPANFFTANNSSQALINWLYGTDRGHGTNSGNLYDYTGNVQLDLGKFGIRSPGADDGPAIGGGVEYRIDREVNTRDAALIYQQGGSAYRLLSQNVKEAYVETNVPLLQDRLYTHLLSLTGSYRWSKYDTQPETFTTWQMGGIYAPIPDITFRASYNKASREPTVYEQDSPDFSYVSGAGDPCAGAKPTATEAQCANTGVTAAEYGNLAQCLNSQCLARSGGGEVHPETAHTLTYGVILKPRFIPGLTVSADYFNIRVDDQIGYSYDSDFMNGCLQFGIPFYCSHIVRNPNGTLSSGATYVPNTNPATGYTIYGSFNAYRDTTKGFDFQAQYTLPVEAIHGSLDFNFNGSLNTFNGGQDSPEIGAHDAAGYYGPFAGNPLPRWKHTFRTTYTTDDKKFSLSANWRFIGDVKLSSNSGNPLIGGTPGQTPITLSPNLPKYSYFDLNASYTIDKRFTLSLVANNVLDKLPPIIPDSYGNGNYGNYLSRANTIVRLYDPLGRFLQIRGTVNF